MPAKNKILHHPDKEFIIQSLNDGMSVRELEARLKQKYPHNKSLQLSTVCIQNFRKEKLQLDGKVLKDIQELGKQHKAEEEQKLLDSSRAYVNKINEIADTKIDVARKIVELDKIIGSRMEYWYNAIASGDENPARGDKELRQFMDRQMNLLAQYKKYVEGIADKTIDYNVNITVMNDQIAVIREAIRECLSEFEPEIALKFMEKLGNKLSNLTYSPVESSSSTRIKLEDLNDVGIGLLEGNKDVK